MALHIDTDMAILYLDFVEERHRVWERRQRGQGHPWTNHPYISVRKFTNVFRVLDWDTQFLIGELINPDQDLSDMDILARCFLFRHTGKREAWQYYAAQTGDYPLLKDLRNGTALKVWSEYRHVDLQPLFTRAYNIYPGQVAGSDKLETMVERTLMVVDGVSNGSWSRITPEARFEYLRTRSGVKEFMAMQVLTDWGYSENCGYDQEQEFVYAGPGAVRGAAHLSPGTKPREVIDWAHNAVMGLAHCPRIETPRGWMRPPSPMDIQNTLCEFSKLVRYHTATSAIRQIKYRPAHPGAQPKPVLPAHW